MTPGAEVDGVAAGALDREPLEHDAAGSGAAHAREVTGAARGVAHGRGLGVPAHAVHADRTRDAGVAERDVFGSMPSSALVPHGEHLDDVASTVIRRAGTGIEVRTVEIGDETARGRSGETQASGHDVRAPRRRLAIERREVDAAGDVDGQRPGHGRRAERGHLADGAGARRAVRESVAERDRRRRGGDQDDRQRPRARPRAPRRARCRRRGAHPRRADGRGLGHGLEAGSSVRFGAKAIAPRWTRAGSGPAAGGDDPAASPALEDGVHGPPRRTAQDVTVRYRYRRRGHAGHGRPGRCLS